MSSKKLDLSQVLQYFPPFVQVDVSDFLQYIQIEKAYSNNTLLAYRNNLYQALGAINQVLAGQQKPQETTGLLDLSDILGKRKSTLSKGKAKITSSSTQAKATLMTSDLNSSIENFEVSYAVPWHKLSTFSWEDCQSKIIQQAISAEYHPGKSASSRNQLLSSLRSFFQWLLQEDKVSYNYPKLVKNLKTVKDLPTVIDKREMQQILDKVAINNFLELRDQVVFEMMFNTGVRLSEVCNLNLQDLDFVKDEITILGKGNVYRTLPLSVGLKQLIALYLILREREIIAKANEVELAEIGIVSELNAQVDINNVGQVYQYAKQILAQANAYINSKASSSVKSKAKATVSASALLRQAIAQEEHSSEDLLSEVNKTETTELDDLMQASGIMSLQQLKSLQKTAISKNVSSNEQAMHKLHNDDLEADLDKQQDASVASLQRQGQSLLTQTGYELQLAEQVKAKLKQKAHSLHAMFLSTHLKRITARAIQYRLDKRVTAAGINRKLSPHKLRHSFASQFLESSANLRAVQEMLGHKNLVTTQIYTHLDLKHLIAVYNQYHPQQIKHQQQEQAQAEYEAQIAAYEKAQGKTSVKLKEKQQKEELIAEIMACKEK
ncbi:tyrosine-type recombinase/integrase [Psittacicella hinzii]|uniref:Tyrosine recombinase XerC n=1 Tax=Psittacicella hinzii TaxID=2028575 RepID=A0A3A1YP28_9GAMM|nr:tyrosine-type recombinase/integrase [Psittacicella hinzii]RIY38999.1 hypothetical protein CKF58_03035 [Psittacicella hinzii]